MYDGLAGVDGLSHSALCDIYFVESTMGFPELSGNACGLGSVGMLQVVSSPSLEPFQVLDS